MPLQAIIPQLNGITADCWISEEHARDLEVTENPIEFGAPVTDHAFVKPQELVVEFGVTNTPLADNLVFGATGTNRIERARELLFSLQDNRTFLSVQTLTGGKYERLLIQSIGWRTDSSNTQSATFTLRLKEVKVVATQTTAYTPLPAEKRVAQQTSKKVKSGEKSAKDISQDKAKADVAKKQEDAIKAAKGVRGSAVYEILHR